MVSLPDPNSVSTKTSGHVQPPSRNFDLRTNMFSFLNGSKDSTNGPGETDASTSVRRTDGDEELQLSDCIIVEGMSAGETDESRIDMRKCYDYPESSPLLMDPCSATNSMPSSSTSASVEVIACPSSIFDEYHSNGHTEHRTRNDRRELKTKKLKGDSLTSPGASTISRIVEIYCILVVGILLFALGLFGGRKFRERPASIYYSPPIQSMGHDGINKNVSIGTSSPQISVGTWYYPWYGGDFHRGEGFVRKLLHQGPALGEYDDRDPKTISQHLHWSRQGNIGLWATSWWGPYTREDNTTRTVILTHEQIRKGGPFEDHKIALFYETFGRIREEEDYSLHRLQSDMEFICEHYLTHRNYYTLEDGRPVLFVYLTRLLETLVPFESVIHIIRKSVRDTCGKDIYIIGDQVFGRFDHVISAEQRLIAEEDDDDKLYSSAATAFDLLDGVTTYDVYGSMGRIVGGAGGYKTETAINEYYLTEQRKWRKFAKQKGCSFIPSTIPGYNDLGVRPEVKHTPLARSLKPERGDGNKDGSFFRISLEKARTLVDPSASYLLMVNSFNEWHEDTQIEPASGESTSMPHNLTHGIEYHGYETLYLDILRNATKDVPIDV